MASSQVISLEKARELVRLMEPDVACIHLEDLKRGHAVHCVDGRRERPTIGVPGGDAGFFLLLLTALKDYSGKKLTVSLIEHLFTSYLEHFGHFYMHTDDHAMDVLRERLMQDERFERFASWFERWDKVLLFLQKEVPRDVSPALRQVLLREHLLHPDFLGCGHLGLIQKHPRVYGVHRVMLRTMLRKFFQQMWAKDERIQLEALRGRPFVEAVFRVVENKTSVLCPHVVALIPCYHQHSVFVYHPDVLRWLIDEAMHMVRASEAPRALDIRSLKGLREQCLHIGKRQAEATLMRLGAGLPVYRVIPQQEHLEVVEESEAIF